MTTKNKKQRKMSENTKQALGLGVPKEAVKLFWKIRETILGNPELDDNDPDHPINIIPELQSIGFPETLDHILSTDFCDGQSRYVRNDELFIELVRYAIFVKSKQLDIEFRNCNKLHWLTGIHSELYELENALIEQDKINIHEEIGDLLFFIFSYAMEHGVLFTLIGSLVNRLVTAKIEYQYTDITSASFRNAAVLSDIEKGTLTSGKGFFKYDLIQNILEISELFASYTKQRLTPETLIQADRLKGQDKTAFLKNILGTTFLTIVETNVQKLGGRYKDKFTAEEDHNRDTTNERIILAESLHG